jgi:trk system potassium uptake protein TrkH
MTAFRPLFYVISLLLQALAGMMLIPTAFDYLSGHPGWSVFFISAALTSGIAFFMGLMNRAPLPNITTKQAFIFVVATWFLFPAFAAIPFMVSSLNLGFVEAFFEATSGLTGTGYTVISGLDTLQPGILLWRSLLNFLGGVGIIVLAVAIMPMLGVGGMQLFQRESSDISGKFMPRVGSLAMTILMTYIILNIFCALGYRYAGMSAFDAINHAMATVSAGGFSTHDISFRYFQNFPLVEWNGILFMALAGLPFTLYFRALSPKLDFFVFYKDTQVRAFFKILIGSVLALSFVRYMSETGNLPFSEILRTTFFNTTSAMTGTGFFSRDYMTWAPLTFVAFYILMFVGGCAGSATSGFKIFRVQIMVRLIGIQLKRVLQPHGVFLPYYNNRVLSQGVVDSVVSFMFIHLLVVCFFSLVFAAYGLDMVTSLAMAISSLSCVGMGLGDITGPSGSLKPLSDGIKLWMSLAMIAGRLEFLAILVLFMPRFWKEWR